MRKNKLYNIFFPFWFMLFFPPLIFGALIINFIVDSLVVIVCLYIYREFIVNKQRITKAYRGCILKTFIFGFLADIIGAILLVFITIMSDVLDINSSALNAVYRNPFESIWGVLIVMSAILVAGYLIYYWNNKKVLVKYIDDITIRARIALILAIVTAPWTFLLPASLIYN